MDVAFYENIFKEELERCLDLYLCPRVFKKRIEIDPESLYPKLPDSMTLKPFPSKLAQYFEGKL